MPAQRETEIPHGVLVVVWAAKEAVREALRVTERPSPELEIGQGGKTRWAKGIIDI